MEGVVTFNPNANHEELEEPQYIDLRQTKEYTLDEYGDPPLLIGTSQQTQTSELTPIISSRSSNWYSF